jgi:hypothetical protein
MGHRARLCAEEFTWQRFRSGVVHAVGEFAASNHIAPVTRRANV